MSKTIQTHVSGQLGPYKGYLGRAEYDPEARFFHGEILGTRDVITFQANHVEDLATEFAASVDDYLEFCARSGDPPEKPFGGRFVARMSPELHRRAAMMADAKGQSLNQFVADCLRAASQQFDPGESQRTRKRNANKKAATRPRRRT